MDVSDFVNTYENLATLCKISYNILNTIDYKFDILDESQVKLFKCLSQKITHIETQSNINVLSVISNDTKTLYIAISGTNDFKDFTKNLYIIQESPDFGENKIKFHSGFLEQACSILDNVLQNIDKFKTQGGKDVFLTGHSSGGCIVSILAYYLVQKKYFDYDTMRIITFGSPLFVNRLGAEWFDKNTDYYRIELHKDPIPRLPMFSDYEHISKNHLYIKKTNIFVNVKNTNGISCMSFIKRIFVKKNNKYYHQTSTYLKKLKAIKNIYTNF
jgi:hypothetical protein